MCMCTGLFASMQACVCVCVCMYVCMYVCMHVCVHVCTYVCMHACMYVCMYVSSAAAAAATRVDRHINKAISSLLYPPKIFLLCRICVHSIPFLFGVYVLICSLRLAVGIHTGSLFAIFVSGIQFS